MEVQQVGQEYADDCSIRSTNTKLIQAFEKQVPSQLEKFSLLVNRDKSEKLSIKQLGVFLGSKLDTAKDINRSKGLASAA